MSTKIHEARIEFKDGRISKVTVLSEVSKGDIRMIVATDSPKNGYINIRPDDVLDSALLVDVADYGLESEAKSKTFPDWKKYL